jgi:hypothetical protein
VVESIFANFNAEEIVSPQHSNSSANSLINLPDKKPFTIAS